MNTDQDKVDGPAFESHTGEKINDEILKMEFAGTSSLFEQSEEFGEKRTALMLTITGVLFASLFALFKNNNDYFSTHPFIFWLMIFAILFLLALGGLTLLRMAHRNITTDQYKAVFRQIKKFYVKAHPQLNKYLYIDPYEKIKNRKEAAFKGGYIEIIKLINSIIFGLLVYMLLSYYNNTQITKLFKHTWIIFIMALAGSVLAWIGQKLYTDSIYDQGYEEYKKRLTELDKM